MKVTHKSRTQYKINSAIMLLLLFIVAILLFWFTHRHDLTFDWTASGRHSLSTTSTETLKKMPGPISIVSYASEKDELRKIIKDTVDRYQRIKPDITLEFINQVAVPQQTAELGITVDGEMLISYDDRTEHVKSDSEEEFTNALNRLLRGEDKYLSFIEGHGERKALGEANHDLGIWVSALNNRGYAAQPLNLTQVNAIPDNTAVLIITQPRIDYLPGEMSLILDYIDKGGNVLWLTEPGELKGLEPLADKLSLSFLPGIIIDYVGQLLGSNDPTISVASATNYRPHDIFSNFDLTTLFPGAVAIDVTENTGEWQLKPLIITGEHTWSEHSTLGKDIEYNEGEDRIGPLNLAYALTRKISNGKADDTNDPEQRILVIGDGDFISNQYLANSGNNELGYRLINWLSNDDDLISIPAKISDDLYLELSDTTKVIIIFGFLILLPLLLLAFGLYIWWRRKHQ